MTWNKFYTITGKLQSKKESLVPDTDGPTFTQRNSPTIHSGQLSLSQSVNLRMVYISKEMKIEIV